MFAANRRTDGRAKDTQINIERSGEFVVNMTDEPLAHAMHESSGDFPPEIGEPDYLNLKTAPSTKIAVPAARRRAFAMECKTWKTIDVNGDRMLIMGRRASSSTFATSCGTTTPCACTWSAIIRSAACSPTAIAAPTTAWCFRRPPARRRPRLNPREQEPS